MVDPRPRRTFARRAWQFIRFTVVKAWRDALPLEASALAYTTLLSLVPLLAAFLFVGERVFREYPLQILTVLSHVLPYSEAAILGAIREFLEQAQLIRGPALAGFLAVALYAVAHVEKTLNRIWQVPPPASIWGHWGRRVLNRVLIFIFVPLAMGGLFSFLLLLRRQGRLQESWWGEILPFAATALALTLLYWLMPNTRVRLGAACAGSLPAAAAFDILRRVFRLYLEAFPAMSLVYGGFALAILFMISIQVAWLMVLLGSEIAYAVQHFPRIDAGDRLVEPPPAGGPQPKPEAES